jgi:hypothetical protein
MIEEINEPTKPNTIVLEYLNDNLSRASDTLARSTQKSSNVLDFTTAKYAHIWKRTRYTITSSSYIR